MQTSVSPLVTLKKKKKKVQCANVQTYPCFALSSLAPKTSFLSHGHLSREIPKVKLTDDKTLCGLNLRLPKRLHVKHRGFFSVKTLM